MLSIQSRRPPQVGPNDKREAGKKHKSTETAWFYPKGVMRPLLWVTYLHPSLCKTAS